jgi:hypothetical protein
VGCPSVYGDRLEILLTSTTGKAQISPRIQKAVHFALVAPCSFFFAFKLKKPKGGDVFLHEGYPDNEKLSG